MKVFYCLRRREPVKTYLVDTAAPGTADTIVAVEPRENWASLDLGRLLAVA